MIETKFKTGTGDNLGFENELEQNPFSIALAEFESNNSTVVKVGEKVTGVLAFVNSKYATVRIKAKDDVVVPMSPNEKSIVDNYQLGQNISVTITSIVDSQNYTIYGSFHELKMNELSQFLETAVKNKTVLTGIVKEMSFAGYTVVAYIDEQEVNLFMPHLLTDVNKLPNPESIVHTEIEFVLHEVYKEGQKSYLASRKHHLLNKISGELRKLTVGGAYRGFITGTTDFAVFVQFNECLTGMIHKTNLSPEAVEYLENGKITPGMIIEFYVKDMTKGKLFLTQVMRESLWDSIKINQILKGKISSIKEFGLMVDLDYETKGLLHKTVLMKPIDTYKKGEMVTVVVTNVDKNKRQITLALK